MGDISWYARGTFLLVGSKTHQELRDELMGKAKVAAKEAKEAESPWALRRCVFFNQHLGGYFVVTLQKIYNIKLTTISGGC